MPRTLYLALVLSLLLARPALPARQAGESSSRPAPDQKEQPAQSASHPVQDTAASAEHDIEVGEYYLRKGDVDAAIGRFQDAIALQPNLAKPRLLLGQACEKKGDKAAAAKAYQEYLRLFPNAPGAKKIEKKIERLTAR